VRPRVPSQRRLSQRWVTTITIMCITACAMAPTPTVHAPRPGWADRRGRRPRFARRPWSAGDQSRGSFAGFASDDP
jgi:hypothetical protein